MKNKVLKICIGILICVILIVGLVPFVNNFLKANITEEQYAYLIISIVFTICLIISYLKFNGQTKDTIGFMKADIDFTRYKKESEYNEDETFYYRNLPFNKDMFKVFWIAFQYNIINNRANILNALLLKWCKENRIRFKSSEEYEILDTDAAFDDENEASLFYMLKDKSKSKFIKLTMFNSKFIFQKVNDILLLETSQFRKENKIIRKNGKDFISNAIKPDVDIVFGFKNFLLNFGSIEDKSPEEVKLWEEYLIYAELLGIADKVKRELNKANIDYSSRETKFKKINQEIVKNFKILSWFSYLVYAGMYTILTLLIWGVYIHLTW